MTVPVLYLDTALIVKLYANEKGSDAVLALVTDSLAPVASSMIARAEIATALHRKLRERTITSGELGLLLDQLQDDQRAGCYRWLPLSTTVLARIEDVVRYLPASMTLSAGDAVHLATAADAGFRVVHSNDRRLLAASPRFGLRGVDPTQATLDR